MEQQQLTEQEIKEKLREAEKAINRAFWLSIWDNTKFLWGIVAGMLLCNYLSKK